MSENGKLTTTGQSIASGGTGGELTAVDSKDGKIVRIRPMHIDEVYTHEELAPSMWEIEAGDKVFRPEYKAAPNYMALAYKERVYSMSPPSPCALSLSQHQGLSQLFKHEFP